MTASGQKILVADDEQNMRIALYEALSRNGYEVSVAENGQMALEMVEKNAPDMLITDIKMPTLDGIEPVTADQGVATDAAGGDHHWFCHRRYRR